MESHVHTPSASPGFYRTSKILCNFRLILYIDSALDRSLQMDLELISSPAIPVQ